MPTTVLPAPPDFQTLRRAWGVKQWRRAAAAAAKIWGAPPPLIHAKHKPVKKCSTGHRFICTDVTSYKIHILELNMTYLMEKIL